MDLYQTLINISGIILILGIIRVVITKPTNLTDLFLKLFLIDLLIRIVDEMSFDDLDNDWDD